MEVQGNQNNLFENKKFEYFEGKQRLFTKHLNQHSETKFYLCQYKNCGYRAERKDRLKQHEIIHLDIFPFECLDCNFKTKHKRALKRHQERYHFQELLNIKHSKYQCKTCGYRTNEKYRLKQHEMIHLKVFPYECLDCEFKTKHKNEFKNHQEKYHVQEHNKNKLLKHNCKTCGYKTSVKSRLKRHEMIHLIIFPFKCPDCNFKTKRQDSLKRHQDKCHVSKPTLNFGDNLNESFIGKAIDEIRNLYSTLSPKHHEEHQKTTVGVCDTSLKSFILTSYNEVNGFPSLNPKQCDILNEHISPSACMQWTTHSNNHSEFNSMHSDFNTFEINQFEKHFKDQHSDNLLKKLIKNEIFVEMKNSCNALSEHKVSDDKQENSEWNESFQPLQLVEVVYGEIAT